MIATWCSRSGNPALERSRQEYYELLIMNFKPAYGAEQDLVTKQRNSDGKQNQNTVPE